VFRGGYWFGTPVNCRSALRNHITPVARDTDYGFRIVRVR
jgi:formylglycine-generating enzyme required for sulfatase activity